MPLRRCLGTEGKPCGALGAWPRGRCPTCQQAREHKRNTTRTHYQGNYRQRAAQVRANATVCWLCGQGPRPHDPWQADHVTPADPNSELRAAHRSCNASRGNHPPGGHPPTG